MMRKYDYIIIFSSIFIFSSCFTDVPFEIPIKKMDVPFTYEIIRSSRQVVLTQEYPWEEQNMLYFNVVKNDTIWQMWYKSYGLSERVDYVGYLCYASSLDGKTWEKKIIETDNTNLKTNIVLSTNNIPVLDQFVFFDDKDNIYRMISAVRNLRKITTNILESDNGIDWVDKKILFEQYYDTQFSVLPKGDFFYIYQREWYKGLRAVGRSIIDRNYNLIESPKVMLLSDDKDFPHIYNNAASYANELLVLFPTLFNNNNDSIKITIGFEFDDELFLTGFDITKDLYFNEEVKWGNVSPGLFPTDEPNTYWMYYYGTSNSHEKNQSIVNNISKYYRIKIRIVPR
jgi:hypothetical protein